MNAECNVKAIPVLPASNYLLQRADSFAIAGDAPKDFLVMGKVDPFADSYVAKAPRVCGPRECATEQLISCIGRMLPLSVAKSKLVRLEGGGADYNDVRFLSRYFLKKGEELIHGVELLAMWMQVSRTEFEKTFLNGPHRNRKQREQQIYSVECIYDVLGDLCRNGELEAVSNAFARMIAFDALVGAQDRHAMNWGAIRDAYRAGPLRFAPVFDTARGLFWHHKDERLLLADRRGQRAQLIRKYAEKSEPLIGGAKAEPDCAMNHFTLIEYVMQQMGREFGPSIRQIVRAFDPKLVKRMLYLNFGLIFSDIRLEFICELLVYRHRKLLKICSLQ